MVSRHRQQLISGFRLTGLATLGSRLLGMARDIATAALFGLSSDGVLDAFVVAFRIPNLFRRLFGEGALTASYLPVLAHQFEHDRDRAWQLATVTLTWLTVLLAIVVLVAEAGCWALGWFGAEIAGVPLLAGLAATLMPYTLLICVTAQLAATLHALSHFAMPALAPIVLNICWLIGVLWIAPHFAPDRTAQAYVLAYCVLVAGVIQLAMQWPPLLRHGFRFDYNWSRSHHAVRKIGRAMLPTVFGLAVTQMNTLADVLLAWGLSSWPGGPATVAWLGGAVPYPMHQGAAAALYYGERLYQFPLGILGVTVATVIFPALSRHAARGDRDRLRADLTLGLRLVGSLALPASVGLVLLAQPIARLLFLHGDFTDADATRTARMIACYGAGVWAYCALPMLVRGFYAVRDQRTPVRIGLAMVGLNLGMDLIFLWPWAETGLAMATTISAAIQVVLLASFFSGRFGSLAWFRLLRTGVTTAVSTAAMAIACWAVLTLFRGSLEGMMGRAVDVFGPLLAGSLVYWLVHRLLGGTELMLLFRREVDSEG